MGNLQEDQYTVLITYLSALPRIIKVSDKTGRENQTPILC
jgi:hypothetical protein